MTASRTPALTQLFVSHISEEAEVAALLQDMLKSDFIGMVKLFASSDVASIQLGDEWPRIIRKAIDKSPAMFVLCSKASLKRPWVHFEIGAAWMKGRTILPVCHSGLKPSELPLPLASLQGIELGTEAGLKKLYATVASLLGMHETPPVKDMAARLEAVAKLEEKFSSRSIQQFEKFLDIEVPCELDRPRIPGDALIKSNEETLEIFGLRGTTSKWKKIAAAAARTPDVRWLQQLQDCVYLASQDKTFQPVQAIYHCSHGAFQPQLAKKEVLPNGETQFHVHLVETAVAPFFEVQNHFGLLATLLRLGLRFRYEVIERGAKQLRGLPRKSAVPPEVVAGVTDQLRKAIATIELEAISRGAERMDRGSIVDLFAWDDDKEAIEVILDEWEAEREKLFATELTLAQVKEVVEQMRNLNFRFMHLGTRRFNEMVDSDWRTTPKDRPPEPARPTAAAA